MVGKLAFVTALGIPDNGLFGTGINSESTTGSLFRHCTERPRGRSPMETAVAGLPRSIDINFMTGGFGAGVLAFAFFPTPPNPEPIAGDAFFNDAFVWESGNSQGSAAFDLMLIAVHEFGHSLGLDRSSDPGSVMRPSFGPNEVFTGLGPEDVAGIQSLYASVPEPSVIIVLASGLAGVAAVAWRRRP